jgi:hypothetical protein
MEKWFFPTLSDKDESWLGVSAPTQIFVMRGIKMSGRTRDFERDHHDDGTRRGDNVFERLRDRNSGAASRRVSNHERDVHDAGFGRGPLVGKTGNPFKDDPFFNPWAPGGTFNKNRR